MVQGGEQPRLALEAREPLGVLAELFGQGLDRDVAVELAVSRAADFPHSAAADRRDDLVGADAGSG